MIDGCGHWRVYWSVVLPLSRPILSALAVFFFLANWNYILAAATVAALPVLVLFFVFQRQIVESIKTSGLK